MVPANIKQLFLKMANNFTPMKLPRVPEFNRHLNML